MDYVSAINVIRSLNKMNESTPQYIPESELPHRRIESSKWNIIFHKIPVGMAMVLQGKEAESAYYSMRKFKHRRKQDFLVFEGIKRGDTVYIVHWSEEHMKGEANE